MTCQNCTNIITDSIHQPQDALLQHQNCWIVYLVSFMVIVGLYKFLKLIIRILSPLSWIPNILNKKYIKPNTKSWALVTGGSEGIGLGFAQQLAKLNFNIILMSRSQTKLKEAKQKILKINSKIQVKYVSVDFQKLRTAQQYEQLLQPFNQFDISLLVNNVGIFNSTKYLDSSYQKIKRQAVVNLLPITCLTRLILPKMIERNKKFNKKSGIINLSSAAAQSSLSYSSHYCATKAYDDLLTSSVANEYRNQGVDFLCLRPYLVTSSMTRSQKSFLHVSANQCAKGALCDLGRYSVSYGHFWHRAQGILVDELNGKIFNYILCLINKDLSMKYKQLDQKKQ